MAPSRSASARRRSSLAKLPAPKKPEAKAPEPKKAASKRTAYDDAAEIVVLVKENPRREGSELYKDFERMRKCKTVADYYKSGGRTSVLGKCIAKKWIKLTENCVRLLSNAGAIRPGFFHSSERLFVLASMTSFRSRPGVSGNR